MSQVHFEQVSSWQGAELAHERFVTDYNAHRIGRIASVMTTA